MIYRQEFSGKQFLAQLVYYKVINYSEPVEYMSGFETEDEVIKSFLINMSLEL